MRKTNILDLPNELLLYIRRYIDPSSLLDHVCLLRLGARTEACYEGSLVPPDFWRQLAGANGLGLTEEDCTENWKGLAIKCAEHAWECTDPTCGITRLRDNGALAFALLELL